MRQMTSVDQVLLPPLDGAEKEGSQEENKINLGCYRQVSSLGHCRFRVRQEVYRLPGCPFTQVC